MGRGDKVKRDRAGHTGGPDPGGRAADDGDGLVRLLVGLVLRLRVGPAGAVGDPGGGPLVGLEPAPTTHVAAASASDGTFRLTDPALHLGNKKEAKCDGGKTKNKAEINREVASTLTGCRVPKKSLDRGSNRAKISKLTLWV